MPATPPPPDDQHADPLASPTTRPRPNLYTAEEAALLTGRQPVSVRLLAQRRHREGRPLGVKLGHQWVFTADEIREIAGIPNRRGRPGKEKKPQGDVDFGKLTS